MSGSLKGADYSGCVFLSFSPLWAEGIQTSLFTKEAVMRRLDGFNLIKVFGLSVLVCLAGYAVQPTGFESLSYAEEPQSQESQGKLSNGVSQERTLFLALLFLEESLRSENPWLISYQSIRIQINHIVPILPPALEERPFWS